MSERLTRFFASRRGIVLVGAIIGALGSLLQKLGNPPNMGICVACFERDIAGALGLHRAIAVQYIRPEIIGFVLGSLIAALVFREFKARAGSAPLVRFVLGAFAMIGALAFLGCPWRANFRLAGGDLTALPALVGLAVGIWLGVIFLKNGYNLGRSQKTYAAVGWIFPLLMVGLLLLAVIQPVFAEGGPIFNTPEGKGPGALHAAWGISLGVGLVIGFLAQRTRFCTMGSVRDVILMGDTHLISGLGALLVTAFLTNLAFGQFHPGYTAQPVAHSNLIWNVLGMVLSGLAYALAGGCPGRQLFLTGEGDSDAGVFVLGMIVGAGFSHNFGLAGTPDKLVEGTLQVGGLTPAGMAAVILGIVVCILIGFSMREKLA
ncbi:membrane protein [Ornatilinea apprima]|uniref:Membrane protein n=1 Tax=Ornatilinea apprima TaxID=1134406 RepID=A0A0P6XZ50_9CHLR|nr:YedE family putative selenium transporter [Ornatilinea apprima]KPL78429.1 membrane protein [Ornatilinea apprima]